MYQQAQSDLYVHQIIKTMPGRNQSSSADWWWCFVLNNVYRGQTFPGTGSLEYSFGSVPPPGQNFGILQKIQTSPCSTVLISWWEITESGQVSLAWVPVQNWGPFPSARLSVTFNFVWCNALLKCHLREIRHLTYLGLVTASWFLLQSLIPSVHISKSSTHALPIWSTDIYLHLLLTRCFA